MSDAKHMKGGNIDKRTILLLVVICAASIGMFLLMHAYSSNNQGGATLGDYENMSKEQIQAELDQQVEDSMMTISLDTTPTLTDDMLAVRVANVRENKFAQLIEVKQDDAIIGAYEGLKPGEKIDEIKVDGAHAGDANITITAMKDGKPSGNPSSFDVVIETAK